MGKIRYGLLHNHTENSCQDSVMTVKQLVTRAKELGAPAVALTDHGTLAGYLEFIEEAKAADVNPIVGVEAYVAETRDEKRKHLILMAKDHQGLVAIFKAVTESNTRLFGRSSTFPCMSKDIIARNFGEGSKGHGHVIATSACMLGEPASILLSNRMIEEKIAELEKEDGSFQLSTKASLTENLALIEKTNAELSAIREEIKALTALSKKSFLKQERELKKLEGEALEAAKAALKAEKQAAADAPEQAKVKKAEQVRKTGFLKRVKTATGSLQETVAKHETLQKEIETLKARIVPKEDLIQEAEDTIVWYNEVFGDGDYYVELQYHGIPEEKEAMPVLLEIAKDLGIRTVAANDAHIPDSTPDSILARTIIAANRFGNWRESASDREMYIKTDEELIAALSEIIPQEDAEEAVGNIGTIASRCHLVLPDEKHYPGFPTPDGSTAEEYLRKIVKERIRWRYPNAESWTEEMQKRLDYELDVICSMGFADYHLIVQDYLNYGRSIGRIGPGRGSAAGSLVCYILGITNIDPMRYDLLFERFLNPERVSMPDIDADFAPAIREKVVDYVKAKYGDACVSRIMTKTRLKAKAAVLAGGRALAARDCAAEGTKSDSRYLEDARAINREMAILTEDPLHMTISEVEEGIRKKFGKDKVKMEILHFAKLVENAYVSTGQHAGGVVISDGNPIDDYVPLMASKKSNGMMTQCDMIQLEEQHLLKMDFLGLNNLDFIDEAEKMIEQNHGVKINPDEMKPDDSRVFKKIFAAGLTDSVFQFESPGMKKMLKRFRPENIDDIILLVAAYRPGPMQYLDDIIDIKNGKKKAKYITPELKPILEKTYGAAIYQEQVQQVFRNLAGYSLGQADLVRRAMSKKKEKVLAAEREAFIHGDPARNIKGCVANGISAEAASTVFDQMMDFAKYGFNKSHAAAYAMVSYETAWLKLYYPLEYMTAVLNHSNVNRYTGLINECGKMGIRVMPPDINLSGDVFSIRKNTIMFGLTSIKGAGKSLEGITEERKNGPFTSVADFLTRTNIGSKTEILADAGAFDSFRMSRETIRQNYDAFNKILKGVRDREAKLSQGGYKNPEKAEAQLKLLQGDLKDFSFDEAYGDKLVDLNKERDVLGTYVTGHPLGSFKSHEEEHCVPIDSLAEDSGYVCIMGVISNLQIRKKKQTGENMAFFTIGDQTGNIDVCCFTKAFAASGDILQDNAVLKLYGKTMADELDDENVVLKFSMDKAVKLQRKEKTLVVILRGVYEMPEIEKKVRPYYSDEGLKVIFYDEILGEFRKPSDPTLRVNPEILYQQEFPVRLV